MAGAIEKRPRRIRGCAEKGCDWRQVMSWYIGGPSRVVDIPSQMLESEYVAHLKTHMKGNNGVTII